MGQEIQHSVEQKLDAIISYGGGGGLALASFMSDLATLAQQGGMIIGFAVMAFKLFRDVEKYLQEKVDKRARKKHGAGKDNPSEDAGG